MGGALRDGVGHSRRQVALSTGAPVASAERTSLTGSDLPEAAALARHATPRVTATIYAGLTDMARAAVGEKLAAAFGG